MKIQNPPVIVSSSEKLPALPKEALVYIAHHLDEPSRVHAALAFKDFAEAVPLARRSLPLPTRLELAGCDPRQPNFHKVLSAFGPADAAASPQAVALRTHYEKGAKLQQAAQLGITATLQSIGGRYIGGASDGERHGFGFWASADGTRHEGEFRKN
ncbi:MAG: hypothetical protein EOO40_04410, partial [Deltaproteobacteria bacterium]